MIRSERPTRQCEPDRHASQQRKPRPHPSAATTTLPSNHPADHTSAPNPTDPRKRRHPLQPTTQLTDTAHKHADATVPDRGSPADPQSPTHPTEELRSCSKRLPSASRHSPLSANCAEDAVGRRSRISSSIARPRVLVWASCGSLGRRDESRGECWCGNIPHVRPAEPQADGKMLNRSIGAVSASGSRSRETAPFRSQQYSHRPLSEGGTE